MPTLVGKEIGPTGYGTMSKAFSSSFFEGLVYPY
jgi:hypothetical protein